MNRFGTRESWLIPHLGIELPHFESSLDATQIPQGVAVTVVVDNGTLTLLGNL